MRLTAKLIDLNGPPAVPATKPTVAALAVNRSVKESVNNRGPEHEPWLGHLEQETVLHSQAKSKILDTDENDYSVSNSSGARGAAAGSRTSSSGVTGTGSGSSGASDLDAFGGTGNNVTGPAAERGVGLDAFGGEGRQISTGDPRGRDQRNVPPRTESSSTKTNRYASASSDINPRTGRAWTDGTIRGF
jgi:hypothetical protein